MRVKILKGTVLHVLFQQLDGSLAGCVQLFIDCFSNLSVLQRQKGAAIFALFLHKDVAFCYKFLASSNQPKKFIK